LTSPHVHSFAGLKANQVEFVRQLKLQAHAGAPQNPELAAKAAGYSAKSAAQLATRMMRKPKILQCFHEMVLTDDDVEGAEVTPEKVLLNWWSIHATDVNELVEHRRDCCRFCYGKGFRYQRTPEEQRRDKAAYQIEYQRVLQHNQDHPNTKKAIPRFETQGGVGFNPHKPPNRECPECHGEGVSKALFKDTRYLSPGARRLYAGVKQTSSGSMEILTRNQDQALQQIAKHLGMLIERKETGKPGEFEHMTSEQLREVLVQKLIDADIPKDVAESFIGVREAGRTRAM
jgi:hypothetical protein